MYFETFFSDFAEVKLVDQMVRISYQCGMMWCLFLVTMILSKIYFPAPFDPVRSPSEVKNWPLKGLAVCHYLFASP